MSVTKLCFYKIILKSPNTTSLFEFRKEDRSQDEYSIEGKRSHV